MGDRYVGDGLERYGARGGGVGWQLREISSDSTDCGG
jgi:hypothetical protein